MIFALFFAFLSGLNAALILAGENEGDKGVYAFCAITCGLIACCIYSLCHESGENK